MDYVWFYLRVIVSYFQTADWWLRAIFWTIDKFGYWLLSIVAASVSTFLFAKYKAWRATRPLPNNHVNVLLADLEGDGFLLANTRLIYNELSRFLAVAPDQPRIYRGHKVFPFDHSPAIIRTLKAELARRNASMMIFGLYNREENTVLLTSVTYRGATGIVEGFDDEINLPLDVNGLWKSLLCQYVLRKYALHLGVTIASGNDRSGAIIPMKAEVARVDALIDASPSTALERISLLEASARCNDMLGDETGDPHFYRKSAERWRFLADQYRAQSISRWGTFQLSFADLLAKAGKAQRNIAELEASTNAYKQLIAETAARKDVDIVAQANAGLGSALIEIGRIDHDPANYIAAETALVAAKDYYRTRQPLKGATIDEQLAVVSEALAQFQHDPARHREAAGYWRAAMVVWAEYEFTRKWARSLHRLSSVLCEIGLRETDKEALTDAIDLYESNHTFVDHYLTEAERGGWERAILLGTKALLEQALGVGAPAIAQLSLFAGAGRKKWFRDISIGPELIVIPAGERDLGSPSHEVARRGVEEDPRTFVVATAFALSRFAITFSEWRASQEDSLWRASTGREAYLPNDEGWGDGDFPVINVSWNDAKAYCDWLSEKTGNRYALPTSSEWEYAARGGCPELTPFWWGGQISTSHCNFNADPRANAEIYANSPTGLYRRKTVAVSEFEPNPWGLYNVHGNVREWTVRDDGMGGAQPLKGGGFESQGKDCRLAFLSSDGVNQRHRSYGFRVKRWL